MKKIILTISISFIVLVCYSDTYAQTGVGIGTSAPDSSAKLDIVSNTQGMLIPRMTQSQLKAIYKPANSLIVYQTDAVPGLYYNSGSPSNPQWIQLVPNPVNTDINLAFYKIENLAPPSSNFDAANKAYVDNSVAALGGKGIPNMISNESVSTMSMGAAMQYCDSLTEGGYKDWYMPTIDQLLYAASGGTKIPDQRYSGSLWTISQYNSSTNFYYYVVDINSGFVSWAPPNSTVKCRCVR